jgi:hypothetical protein
MYSIICIYFKNIIEKELSLKKWENLATVEQESSFAH